MTAEHILEALAAFIQQTYPTYYVEQQFSYYPYYIDIHTDSTRNPLTADYTIGVLLNTTKPPSIWITSYNPNMDHMELHTQEIELTDPNGLDQLLNIIQHSIKHP